MKRRRFLQIGSAAAVTATAGCNSFLADEEVQFAAKVYEDGYFLFKDGRGHMTRARLARQEGRSQAHTEELELAIEDFDAAKSQFNEAAEPTSRKPEQDANRASKKSDLLGKAAKARLNGNPNRAIELENSARGMQIVDPREWKASTSL